MVPDDMSSAGEAQRCRVKEVMIAELCGGERSAAPHGCSGIKGLGCQPPQRGAHNADLSPRIKEAAHGGPSAGLPHLSECSTGWLADQS